MRYIVQPWETWETIDTLAARFNVTLDELMMANPILNTARVIPGMILTIPGYPSVSLPPNGYIEYVVQSGDSIYNIANRFRLNYRNIIADNPQLVNPDVIWPGQIIYLLY
jgi:LysM repeat protein